MPHQIAIVTLYRSVRLRSIVLFDGEWKELLATRSCISIDKLY